MGALGCSAETPTARSTANMPPTAAASPDGTRCQPVGLTACYCDDGAASGTQNCDATGKLSPCGCLASSLPPITNTPVVTNTPPTNAGQMALCPELQSLSGCMAQSYEGSQLPASVLFVVDRSGSMACNPPPLQDSAACEANAVPVDGAQPSKWSVTVSALEQVFDSLLAQGSTANVGLGFFSNNNTCGVQSLPSVPLGILTASQVAALKGALDNTIPSGGTPLVGATALGYAYLHQEATSTPGCQEPCGAPGNRYVVLITDGTDSCPMPTRAEDAAECAAAGSCTNFLVMKEAPLAAQANIRTFVIGAPGSEPARGYLSELAFVGGTARSENCLHDPSGQAGDCHFDMTTSQDFAASLASALSAISGAALGCEFAVPPSSGPVTAGSVNVQFRPASGGTPECFAYDPTPCEAGANGWQFAKLANGTEDTSRVVICGAACDEVRAAPTAHVDVILGCETINVL